MNKKYQHQKGATIVLFTLLLTVLIGFMGLAIDGGYMLLQKTRLQNTADAAALACVINSTACGSGGSNLFPDVNLYGFDVQTTKPVVCPKTTQLGCVEAVASSTWNTFFLGILGQSTLSLHAKGIAGKNSGGATCVITDASFSTNGTNNVVLNNCSAAIGGSLNTTNNSGIVINPNTGANTITIYNGNSTTCGKCTPAPIGSAGSMPVAANFTAPTIAAAAAPTYNASTKTYTYYPGSYASPVVFDKKYNYVLSSGAYGSAYVFNGGLDTGSAVVTNEAGGVSIYVPGNKSLKLSGTVTLSAPTPTGCLAGSAVVINHPYTNTYYNLTMNGSQDHLNLTGVANLSADNLTVSGTSTALSVTGSFVINSLTLHGNMNPSYSANPCNNVYVAGGIALFD
jgi:Putative Flp pilus-assembly TadE/G-like